MSSERLKVDDAIHALTVTQVPFEWSCATTRSMVHCAFRVSADLGPAVAVERWWRYHRAEYQEAEVSRL